MSLSCHMIPLFLTQLPWCEAQETFNLVSAFVILCKSLKCWAAGPHLKTVVIDACSCPTDVREASEMWLPELSISFTLPIWRNRYSFITSVCLAKNLDLVCLLLSRLPESILRLSSLSPASTLLLPQEAESHCFCPNNNQLPSDVNKAIGLLNK